MPEHLRGCDLFKATGAMCLPQPGCGGSSGKVEVGQMGPTLCLAPELRAPVLRGKAISVPAQRTALSKAPLLDLGLEG